jgi:methanogen homocitrate synthase
LTSNNGIFFAQLGYIIRAVKDEIYGGLLFWYSPNDFGMAVATELAAVTAGAEVVHGCVNGIGERTGNAAIEELMVGLHILLGFETNYKLDRIGQLCKLVRDLSGVQPANNKPVIGEENYTRESGIGVDLLMKNPLAMFATTPQLFGREGKVVLGKKSGKTSITYTLEKLGIKNVSDEAVTEILKEVKDRGTEKRALLSMDEFSEIVSRRLK